MNEHEPRPAEETDAIDWRRLEVAIGRFGELIAGGIMRALAEHTEVDGQTARCLAHVLGRAYGRSSKLAEFGRTGEGSYLELREEYLDLYTHADAQPQVKELIDWLGTYLVARENTGSGRRFMNEHLPPTLDKLLVRTEVSVRGQPLTIHLPASLDNKQIDELTEGLQNLNLDRDEALQAFLSLPDVDANTEMIMESFHEAFAGTHRDKSAALRALSPLEEWETELTDWRLERGVDLEALEWNLAPLLERLREIYDLVEWKGKVHAFYK